MTFASKFKSMFTKPNREAPKRSLPTDRSYNSTNSRGLGGVKVLVKRSDVADEREKAVKNPMYEPGRPKEYRNSEPRKNVPPTKPGEYRILDKDRNITYIGETNNLARRKNEHRRSGKLREDDIFAWKTASKDSTSDTRREHERQKIKEHKPPLNKSRGGEGRKAI